MAIDIVFRGDLVAGKNILEVKEGLISRFKLNSQDVEKMFSGRPVVLKKGLTEDAADTLRAAFFKVGAMVELRVSPSAEAVPQPVARAEQPVVSEPQPESQPEQPQNGMTVKPAGSPVLNDDERVEVEPVAVDVSGISLAPEGSDVLEDQHKRVYESLDLDTSHITLD